MPEKKENIIQIREDYNTDLKFAEGKINYEVFAKKRQEDKKEQWNEIRYVASNPFLLHTLLKNLKVEHRLRAFKRLNEYTFEDIKQLGFGGSIHMFFKYAPGNLKDRGFTANRARLATILDIPIVFALMDKPTPEDRIQYNFMEYRELGERVSFKKLKDKIVRPERREISSFILESSTNEIDLFVYFNETLFCRVDLRKTFFVVELHLQSCLSIEIQAINRLVEYFDNRISYVILSSPVLRDSFKLSLIGTYIKEQQVDANKFSDNLIKIGNGKQLYPYNFYFDNIIPN